MKSGGHLLGFPGAWVLFVCFCLGKRNWFRDTRMLLEAERDYLFRKTREEASQSLGKGQRLHDECPTKGWHFYSQHSGLLGHSHSEDSALPMLYLAEP